MNWGQVDRNQLGQIAHEEWLSLGEVRNHLILDEFVIMPNHVHGLVALASHDVSGVEVSDRVPIGNIVGQFKQRCTKQIRIATGDPRMVVWQRGYYDHVVRDDRDLERIRGYIRANPMVWSYGKGQ